MKYPIKVIDVELSEPLGTIDGLEHYRGIQVLVRLHGTPLGWLRLPVWNGRCSREELAHRVVERLDGPVLREALQNALSRGLSADPAKHPLGPPRPTEDHPLPTVTVAVCTRDRTEELAECLASLEALDYPSVERLVVDNAPASDATERLVASYPQVRYVAEPRPGLDWARNRAIAEAAGEIIAFTDDDALVDPGWVRAIVSAFDRSPDVMAVTGLVVPLELGTEAQVLFEEYGGFGRGFEAMACSGRGASRVAPIAGGAGRFGTGANMAFRSSLFQRVGPFDPALDVGTVTCGGGDLEMFFRTIKEGFTLAYEPRAIVRHRHRRDYDALRAQLHGFGLGLSSHFVRSALEYPDERFGFVRFAFWWLGRWHLQRLARSFWKPWSFPRELIWTELHGTLIGFFRYPKARRESAAIAVSHGPQPSVSRLEPSPSAPVAKRHGIAVRAIELSAPVGPINGVDGYRDVRLFATWDGQPVASVDVPADGATVDGARVRKAIADHLTAGLPDEAPALAWIDDQLALGSQPWKPSTPAEALAEDVAVSVVVATRDRPDRLRECLRSLHAQRTARKVEIVVVDNHSQSGLTPPVVVEFPGVALIDESRRGVSYARNTGFVACTGDIVATVDDDVITSPDWLERLVAPFGRQDVMAVTGLVLPFELETPAQILFEEYGGLGRGFDRLSVGRRWFEAHRLKAAPTWELGGTANAAFRTSLFAEPDVGLMAEHLGPGMPSGVGEDTYLFYRLLKAGHSLIYEPSAYVWHCHRRTSAELRKQLFDYSKGHVAYNLTTLLNDGDGRGLVRVLVELPLAHAWRAWLRFRGRSNYPYSLLLLEIAGNLLGPISLWRSFRRVRRLGRSMPYQQVSERPSVPRRA